MSNPFRDAAARKRSNRRERIRDEYTPMVLWVKPPEEEDTHEVRKWIEAELSEMPYVGVATKDTPYNFATDGCLREEDADGNTEDEE